MARRSKKVDFLENLSDITEQMQDKDREANLRRERERGELSTLPLERIKSRESNTRSLNTQHVESLKESISTLGLIEPLAVDQAKVLLAGGHRLAAIALLRKTEPETFEKHFPNGAIPVRIMPFIAEQEPDKALQVEVAENEYRRDYTPAEVRGIAKRLIAAGYKDAKGRPKKGEKVLMPALSTVVGKNRRTIQRYLHGSPKSDPKKSRTDVHLFIKKAKKSLESWQKQPHKDSPASRELNEQLPHILSLLDAAIRDEPSDE